MEMKKSKLLMSLIVAILLVLVIGNISVLATEPTQITANGGNKVGATNTNSNNTNKENTNTNTNKASNLIGAAVTNQNTNNTNTNKANTSNYQASTNSSKLPYAGTGSTSIILVAIAFAGSAVYAYKKVSDYNI